MEKQLSFSDMEKSGRKRVTRREKFLRQMDAIIPWEAWVELIRPYYPSGHRGRPSRGIEPMLRMYLLQVWFNLSDEGTEDAVCDSEAMRNFVGIDFMGQEAPDATTLLKFRHLLEKNGIGEMTFAHVKQSLEQAGLMMHGGSIVDATIVGAPPSTKNAQGRRDPEMHQAKKGNQWHFGMKVHIGVDAGTGYIHTLVGTAANVHGSQAAAALIRDDDHVVYGDSGYPGVEKQAAVKDDPHLSTVEFRVNKRPKSIRENTPGTNWEKAIGRSKSSVRSKVEHPFLIDKRLFGYAMVAYRGLAKNMNRFMVLFASANLLMCARAGRSLAVVTGE